MLFTLGVGSGWGVGTEHSSGKQLSSRTPAQLRPTEHLREETRVCASGVIRGLHRVLVHVSQRFGCWGDLLNAVVIVLSFALLNGRRKLDVGCQRQYYDSTCMVLCNTA